MEIDDVASLRQYKNIYQNCDYVVDAIFGTGLCREIRSPIAEIITEINSWKKAVFALDTPSGLDCDSGEILGVAIDAKKTITFALAKNGFYKKHGAKQTGQVEVVPISIPKDIIDNES